MKTMFMVLFLLLFAPLANAQNAMSSIGTQFSGTTFTLSAKNCNTIVESTGGSAATVTVSPNLPQYCQINVLQGGAGQVTIAAASGASIQSVYSYTQTYGQGAKLSLYVDTNVAGTAAHVWISGDGGPMGGGGGSLKVQDTQGTPNVVTNVTTLTMGNGFLVQPPTGTTTATVTPNQNIVTYSGSHTISAGSDNGTVFNMTGGGTLTINAISSSNLPGGVSFIAQNGGTSPIAIVSTPTIKIYGSTTIPVGGAMACTSDNTSLWCPSLGVPPVVTSLLGSSNPQSGATYTLAASDCGKTLLGTDTAAMTWTVPASIAPAVGLTCVVGIVTTTANKISVNGSAVTAASLVSANSYTGTTTTPGSQIVLTITTVGSTATAFLAGNGS